jgi:hypothetical protein
MAGSANVRPGVRGGRLLVPDPAGACSRDTEGVTIASIARLAA